MTFTKVSSLKFFLCVLAGCCSVSESGRVENLYEASQYQALSDVEIGSCGEPDPVPNTVREHHHSYVTYTCREGAELTSGNPDVTCPSDSSIIIYPTCNVNCGEPLQWGTERGISYSFQGGHTLGGTVEYTCTDWGESVAYTTTCTHNGWSNEEILCRSDSTDLAAGLDLAVRSNGNIKHTQGCADVSAERGRVWIGVQFTAQNIDVYLIEVFDDQFLQNQISTPALTIKLSRGDQVVAEHVIQAEGAALNISGRNIDGVWLRYQGMTVICGIKIFGQPHLGGCPNLFPPHPAVIGSSDPNNPDRAHIECPSGFVYAGGSKEMYCDTDGSWKFEGLLPIECIDGPNLAPGARYLFETTENENGMDTSTYSESSGILQRNTELNFDVHPHTTEVVLTIDLLSTFVIDRIALSVEGASVSRVEAATEDQQTVAVCQEELDSQGIGTALVHVCDYLPEAHKLSVSLSVGTVSTPTTPTSISDAVRRTNSQPSTTTQLSGQEIPVPLTTTTTSSDLQPEAPQLPPFSSYTTQGTFYATPAPNYPPTHGSSKSSGFESRHSDETMDSHSGETKRKKRSVGYTTTVSVTELNIVGSSTLNGVLECYKTEDGRDYKGHLNVSSNGLECLSWSDEASGLGITDQDFPDPRIEDARNYCRNPKSFRKRPWCVTTEGIAWCTVFPCEKICSDTQYGFDYGGDISFTAESQSCLPWTTSGLPFTNDEEFLGGDRNHSYCRNPARSQSRPWCYVSDSSQLCIVARCPTVERFMAAEAVFYNAYIAFLISIAVSNGQMNCYMLDDGEDIRVVRVLPSDLQPRCDGEERYITIVCHTDAQLYEEDRPTWLHTTIDCGPREVTTMETTLSTTESPTATTITNPPTSSLSTNVPPTSSSTAPPTDSQSTADLPAGPPSPTVPPAGTPSPTVPPADYQSTADLPAGPPSPTVPPAGAPSTPGLSGGTPTPTVPPAGTPSPTVPLAGTPSTLDLSGGTPSPSVPSASYPSTNVLSTSPSPTASTASTPDTVSSSPGTTTQSPGRTYSSLKLCPCDCSWNADAVYTEEEVKAAVEKITKELSVPTKNLSSEIRSKTSADDSRQSAVSTGVVGLVLTAVVCGAIVSLDFLAIVTHIRQPQAIS